jgi:hypothetical protein
MIMGPLAPLSPSGKFKKLSREMISSRKFMAIIGPQRSLKWR